MPNKYSKVWQKGKDKFPPREYVITCLILKIFSKHTGNHIERQIAHIKASRDCTTHYRIKTITKRKICSFPLHPIYTNERSLQRSKQTNLLNSIVICAGKKHSLLKLRSQICSKIENKKKERKKKGKPKS